MRKILLLVMLMILAISPASGYDNEEDSIDWDNVPVINTRRQLADYVYACLEEGKYIIPVVYEDGFMIDIDEFADRFSCYRVDSETINTSSSEAHVLYTITPYPGDKAAYAYLNEDTSGLNADELKLYDIAVNIVQQAMDRPTALQRELYIHDAITEYVKHYDSSTARGKTALGVFLDGRANCQGYSDAFYMLGTMCGLDVGKMSGQTNGENHVWNTIRFDGKVYFVDTTWADTSFSIDGTDYTIYIYFNAPAGIMKATHSWDEYYEPEDLQQEIDGMYFFFTDEFESTNGKFFGTHEDSAQDAIDYIVQRIGGMNLNMSYIMTPYSKEYSNADEINKLLLQRLEDEYEWHGQTRMNIHTRNNKYMYFTVNASEGK